MRLILAHAFALLLLACSGSNPLPPLSDGATDVPDGSADTGRRLPTRQALREHEATAFTTYCDCTAPSDLQACRIRMQAEWGIDQCQLQVPEADQTLIEDTMFGCIADATAELAVCLAENECLLSNQRRWERCFESYASVRAECYYAAYGTSRAYTNWYNAWQRCAEGSFPGGTTCQEDVEQGQPSEATSSNLDDPVFEGVLAHAGRNLTPPPSCIVAGYEDHLVHEPDVMHLWRAPETANYRFSSAGSEAFGLLWVSETCSGPHSACSGYPQPLFTQTPSFNLSATAGTTYLVMFKGSVEGDAAYRISIFRE